MSAADAFFDTNLLLYLLSEDATKADRAEEIVANGGLVNVQVLNEFTSVARRKLKMEFNEIQDFLAPILSLCRIEPLTIETYELGITLAERYHYSFYDSLILAAALIAGCDTLYSEDLQHRQRIEQSLVIHNPFR